MPTRKLPRPTSDNPFVETFIKKNWEHFHAEMSVPRGTAAEQVQALIDTYAALPPDSETLVGEVVANLIKLKRGVEGHS